MVARSFVLSALLFCASCSDDSSSGEAGGGASPTGGSPGTGGAGAGSDGGAGGLATGGSGGEPETGGGPEGGAMNSGGAGGGGGEACANADGVYTGSYSWTFEYNGTTTVCTGELTVSIEGEDISGEGNCMFDTGTEWDSTMIGTLSLDTGAAEGSFTPGVGLALGSTTWSGQLECAGGFVLAGELAPKQRGGNLTEGDFSVERE